MSIIATGQAVRGVRSPTPDTPSTNIDRCLCYQRCVIISRLHDERARDVPTVCAPSREAPFAPQHHEAPPYVSDFIAAHLEAAQSVQRKYRVPAGIVLAQSGYATDPAYSAKLNAIIRTHKLEQYDNGRPN
ncbi:hypothetical protein [Paraburkholderia pallida]|uniref:Mannosyl-glycoprotein endo-beta-N-acetylglucosamidase-like domain-containing protein n=1 Tax=Paraburkholderia pallida TaxID=2547399 RepID=A0A4P7CSK8_9BURK|nr:hypothetical protein [Paraburkholderia pallida]QBQ98948.1 hypothetical protein E1956_17015 [Paraburkholderia pallida]